MQPCHHIDRSIGKESCQTPRPKYRPFRFAAKVLWFLPPWRERCRSISIFRTQDYLLNAKFVALLSAKELRDNNCFGTIRDHKAFLGNAKSMRHKGLGEVFYFIITTIKETVRWGMVEGCVGCEPEHALRSGCVGCRFGRRTDAPYTYREYSSPARIRTSTFLSSVSPNC